MIAVYPNSHRAGQFGRNNFLNFPSGKQYYVSIWDSALNNSDGWYRASDNIAFATINTGNSSYYYVTVFGDGDYSANYDYTLTVCRYNISALGNLEINNYFNNADNNASTFTNTYLGSTTKTATPISFSIDSPIDEDRYKLTLAQGDKISVQMDLPSNYNDSAHKYRIAICSDVYQSTSYVSWTERLYNNPDSTNSKFATFIAPSAGTYYVSVKSAARQFNYSLMGTLRITKTPLSSLDQYENKGWESTNDFIFSAIFALGGQEYGVNGATIVTGNVNASGNLDNELDTDWFRYQNGTQTKTASIQLTGGTEIQNGAGLAIFDRDYKLLSTGGANLLYALSPNEVYYIAAYVKDGAYNTVKDNRNYTLSIKERTTPELKFAPENTNEYYIFCNSPEGIKAWYLSHEVANGQLSTNGNPYENVTGPKLLMQQDLAPGTYTLFYAHLNWVKDQDGAGNIPIYIDAQFEYLDGNATVQLTNAGYSTGWDDELDQAWADYRGKSFQLTKQSERTGRTMVEPETIVINNPTITLNAGNSVGWIGEHMNSDYLASHQSYFDDPLFMMVKFTVSGSNVRLNLAGFEHPSMHSPNALPLPWLIRNSNTDPQQNGIPNGQIKGYVEQAPIMKTDVSFTINNATFNGIAEETINNKQYYNQSVKIYNVYHPNGTDCNYWTTNLNPKDNVRTVTQSDMVTLKHWSQPENKWWNFGFNYYDQWGESILGNYGITNKYCYEIYNDTGKPLSFLYQMADVEGHIFAEFAPGNNASLNSGHPNVMLMQEDFRTYKTIFDVNLQPGLNTFTIETTLGHAAVGGMDNKIYIECP
jgi:hypothetical protein